MTTTTTRRRGTIRGREVTAAVGALVAGLALTACGSQVAGRSGDLPVLRIGTGGGAAAPAAAGSGQDPYPLDGTLPTGPSSAAVLRYDVRPLPAGDVAALALALGVTGTPVRHPRGWEVTSRSGTVRVRDGGTAWSWSRGTAQCPSYAVDIDNTGGAVAASGCAVAVPTSSMGGTAATQTISAATALAAARPVLAAVGLAGTTARVLPGTNPRTVVVDPVVDGRPTSGVQTSVDVGRSGALGALGVLSTPAVGDTYPIVTAAAALDMLRAMPQPEIAIACVQGQACPGLGPRVVTGARLGLTMAYDGGDPVLVPAWLFAIRGSDDPVAVVAVERRYLADPTSVPDGGATASASTAPGPGRSGGGSGSAPGTGVAVPPVAGSATLPGPSGAPDSAPLPASSGATTKAPPVGPATSGSASDLPLPAVSSGGAPAPNG